MAITTRSDLVIVTEVLQKAIAGAYAGMRALSGSRAVVMNASMQSTQGGDLIKIPYFGTLGEFSIIPVEGDAVEPRKLTMTSETASTQHAALAFEQSVWSRLTQDPQSDAYEEAGKQIAEAGLRLADAQLIATAEASLPAMTLDVWNASTPRKFDYDLMADAKMLWGDEQDEIVLIAVHSKVYGDLIKLKDSTGRPLLTDPVNGETLQRFMNVPIKVSDRLTVSADAVPKYTSLLFKERALAFWFNGGAFVETDKDILAHTNITATHLYFASHRYSRLPGKTKGGVAIIKSN